MRKEQSGFESQCSHCLQPETFRDQTPQEQPCCYTHSIVVTNRKTIVFNDDRACDAWLSMSHQQSPSLRSGIFMSCFRVIGVTAALQDLTLVAGVQFPHDLSPRDWAPASPRDCKSPALCCAGSTPASWKLFASRGLTAPTAATDFQSGQLSHCFAACASAPSGSQDIQPNKLALEWPTCFQVVFQATLPQHHFIITLTIKD